MNEPRKHNPVDNEIPALVRDYVRCDAEGRARIRDLVKVIADAQAWATTMRRLGAGDGPPAGDGDARGLAWRTAAGPCPKLDAMARDDMCQAALDCLRRTGAAATPAVLRARYAFTAGQVADHGEAAIAAATRLHERDRAARTPAVTHAAVTHVAGGNGAAIPVRGPARRS